MPITLHTSLRRLAGTALIGLSVLAALPAAAQPRSFDGRYEGTLVSDSGEVIIPINVQLRDTQGMLTGQVRTETPMTGTGPVSAGDYNNGNCNLRVQLTPGTTLRMSGTCLPKTFEGKYTLNSSTLGTSSGSFRLARKNDGSSLRNEPMQLNPLTLCLNANTRCLVACPQGDYNTEFLCANRCRQRFQACKGKAASTGPGASTTGDTSPP